MTLTAIELPLQSPFAELFERCAQEPWALLLDSCDHPHGRYDFIFRQPAAVVTDSNNWPQQLRQALATVPAYHGPAELPFQGGLAGAFSYDAGRALEQLPAQALADIELPEIAVAVYHQALIRRRSDGVTWLLAEQQHLAALKQFWLQPHTTTSDIAFSLTTDWQSNLSATGYQRRFLKIQDYLQAGDCYQINLAQRFTATYQGDPWQAYLHLRQHNNAPFSGFFRLPSGAVLSHSPERFLQVSASGAVETKPIKGTRPRSDDAIQDRANAEQLAQSAKDRAENVMIVDLLRNDLSRCCEPGSVKVPALFAIESYPAVHHLVSTVTGQLRHDQSALDLLAACFPGGSITGAPKIRAMEIIDELEPHRRSYYCGSFAYISQHGAADSSIAIRTLVAYQQQLFCWAGGGIVADSEGSSEYQETLDKVAKILPLLAALP